MVMLEKFTFERKQLQHRESEHKLTLYKAIKTMSSAQEENE